MSTKHPVPRGQYLLTGRHPSHPERWLLERRQRCSGCCATCRAAAGEDTEDMNRERAETYLRALAETELRRATMQPWEDAQRAGHAGRVKRVAQVLALVGALDAGVADQILGDFELALGARLTGQAGSVAGWFPRRATLATGVSVPPAAAGGSAAGRPGAGASRRAGARAGSARADSAGRRRRCPEQGLPVVVRAGGGRPAVQRVRADASAVRLGGAIGSAAFRPVHRPRLDPPDPLASPS